MTCPPPFTEVRMESLEAQAPADPNEIPNNTGSTDAALSAT